MNGQSREVLRLIRAREERQRQEQLRANRRRHVRISIELPLRFRLLAWCGQKLRGATGQGEGQSVDLSLSGVSFVTDLQLPDGLVLELEFAKAPWSALNPLECVVVRTDRVDAIPVVAVEFIRLRAAVRHKLHALILNWLRTLS